MIRFLHAYIPKRTLLLGISEACLITLRWWHLPWRGWAPGKPSFMLTYQYGSLKILFVSVAFLMCMYYFDLYDSAIVSNRREALVRLIQVMGVAYIALGLLYYLYPPVKLGRGIFQHRFSICRAVVACCGGSYFPSSTARQGLAERVMILGEGTLAESLLHEIETRPELGIRVAGRAQVPANVEQCGIRGRGEMPIILSQTNFCEELAMGRQIRRIDRIVVAMEERRGKMPVDLLLSLKNRGVQVQDGNDVYESITGKVPIESIRLSWLLFSPGSHASRLFLMYKRFASVVVSIVGLLLSLPLFPFIILAIKLSSRGRVFYWQNRVGRDGVVFRCYKFRTMRSDAEAEKGPTWAQEDDPRITSVGRFLRKTRIDEIPQLWNVLKGDMSLVGPRPERPSLSQCSIKRFRTTTCGSRFVQGLQGGRKFYINMEVRSRTPRKNCVMTCIISRIRLRGWTS